MTTKTRSLLTATLLLSQAAFAETTLEDITVVSSNKIPTSIQNTTANISIVTHQDIIENGYHTVAEALRATAGIIISQSGGWGQTTSIFTRGMEGGQTLILLDGMRLNDPSTPNGAAHLESLSTDNIAQIEIIKGGQSSIWGSNASAGIINIITKTPKDGTHGSVTIGYGAYNTREIASHISYQDKKLTAQLTGSYLKTKGFSSLAPRNAEADGYTNKNYNIKLGYAFTQNHRLTLNINRIDTNTQYDGTNALFKPDPQENKSYVTSTQKNYALDYYFVYDNYTSRLRASQGNYTREDYYNGKTPTLYNAQTREYAFVNAYTYTQGKAILGLEYKEIKDRLSVSPLASYTNKAVYLSNLYHLDANTLLETNLRYDRYNTFKNKTTYKIGLKHNNTFIKGLTASANYYTSYDAPTIYQIAPSNYVAANPNLKPSYTRGFDLTLGYKKLISLTYFNNKVEDYIDYLVKPFPAIGNYYNVSGKSKFEGMEITSSYTFSPYNLVASGSYTHLIKAKKFDNTDFIRRPKDILNISLDYYTDSDIHFGIQGQYIGNRLDKNFNTRPATIVSTGNYTLWNLNFNTTLMDNMNLDITAKNIFDRQYQEVYSYATAGRSVYAKINYHF